MGKDVVEIKPNDKTKNQVTDGTDKNGETGEKISFWKHPIKAVKAFDERHPRVKWIIGGVVAAGAAVTAWALGGGKKDDEPADDYVYEEDEPEETNDSED